MLNVIDFFDGEAECLIYIYIYICNTYVDIFFLKPTNPYFFVIAVHTGIAFMKQLLGSFLGF